MLGVSIWHLSKMVLFDFGTVSTECFISAVFHVISKKRGCNCVSHQLIQHSVASFKIINKFNLMGMGKKKLIRFDSNINQIICNYCLHLRWTSGKQLPSGEQLWCSPQVQAIIDLLYWNSIYNNVGCNKHLFVFLSCVFINFIFVFLNSGQDSYSGMQKRIHFQTDMEHSICRSVSNSDDSLGYQFCKKTSL